jgi:eukaryotic-like serine/threonine-protein kinase
MSITAGTRLGHYEIRSTLGAGGQGQVYKAVDTTLDRPVVIKVLFSDNLVKPSAIARFEREAKLASSLDHPNICTIHGLHEVDGVRFIAMQYIEGQTVRELVAGKPQELNIALSVAIQVADALAAAHSRGIIHRDIKPGNVMVTDSGMVKVLDFGLAKLLEQGNDDSNDEHLTQLGVPYGTASSAAPEQATGEPTDHRTDIFSTGVLLYEMLTGTWPFKGKSVVEVRYAVIHETPQPLAEARNEQSTLITRLQEIIDRTLSKNPDDRYQQIEELRNDLRAVLREIDADATQAVSFTGGYSVVPRNRQKAGVFSRLLRHKVIVLPVLGALLLAIVLGGYFFLNRDSQSAIDTLAVLPFTNINADPSTEYLSEGITESLINSLSQLPAIKVRSRNSVFHYKGQEADTQKIGRELDVGAVLVGRVEKRGEDMSVSVELIDTKDNSQIWGERYTRKLSDLLSLQQELSRSITDNLRLRLSGAEDKQLVKNYDTNSESYQLYLQGRYYWNKRTAEGLRKGIEYFTNAIEKDKNYAPAYSGLADCYWLLNVYNLGPATESSPKAEEAAKKAIALDEKLAESYASLAAVSYRYNWNWADAEKNFKHSIQFKPDYATAHQWYSAMLAAMGRFDESNAEGQRARDLEPFSLTINSDVGRHHFYARQFDQAIATHQKSLEMDPNFARGHVELGYVFAQVGRHEEAVSEFQQALSLDKDSINALVGLGHAYALAGKKEQALEVVGQLKKLAEQRYISPYHFAVIYIPLGEREQALTGLEKAADERFNLMVFLTVEPLFESLRSEPRFVALTERLRLKP